LNSSRIVAVRLVMRTMGRSNRDVMNRLSGVVHQESACGEFSTLTDGLLSAQLPINRDAGGV